MAIDFMKLGDLLKVELEEKSWKGLVP